MASGTTARPGPVRIEVSGLTKTFGTVRAVSDLGFTVEPGSVTGFLGPNGAGKTTTLRMVLGLVTPDAGTATFDGVPYAALREPVRTVGAVLETAFHPARSGRDHLRVYCRAAGIPVARADEVLERVGLTTAGRRRAGCTASSGPTGRARPRRSACWPPSSRPTAGTRGCSATTWSPTPTPSAPG